jgi:hypothetical protein
MRLLVDYSASRRLVVDYFASAARHDASARRAALHAARRAARRRLLRLALARFRLLRPRRAFGCLGTLRGSSCGSSRRSSSTTPRHAGSVSTTPPRAGSSSTTSPPSRVRVPRHVTRLVTRLVAPLVVDYSASRRLVIDYFAYTARLGTSARRTSRDAARHAARRRLLSLAQACRGLLSLGRVSGCLGTSRGSSCGSSWTTPRHAGSSSTTSPPLRALMPRHVARLVTRLVAPPVVDYSASRWLVFDYFAPAARSGASAHRAARHAARRAARRRLLRLSQAHRRLLRLAQARRRLLRLRLASG